MIPDEVIQRAVAIMEYRAVEKARREAAAMFFDQAQDIAAKFLADKDWLGFKKAARQLADEVENAWTD